MLSNQSIFRWSCQSSSYIELSVNEFISQVITITIIHLQDNATPVSVLNDTTSLHGIHVFDLDCRVCVGSSEESAIDNTLSLQTGVLFNVKMLDSLAYNYFQMS